MFPNSLTFAAHDSLSVYLHLPFCSRKCGYCDFFSVVPASDRLVSTTVRRTVDDLRDALERLQTAGRLREIRSLYVGGGTPSSLPREVLDAFLESVGRVLPAPPGEFTIEANPESIDEPFLDALDRHRVGRLSLGIQSFCDLTLRYLGRRATARINHAALEMIRARYRGLLNVDLIVAGRTRGEAARSIDILTTRYRPAHVSLYLLTVEPGTPLSVSIGSGAASPVDEDFQSELWREGIDALERAGYRWYEVSSFAVIGRGGVRRCAHNMGYWRMAPYLGIGPGAVSTLAGEQGPLRIEASRAIPSPSYRVESITPEEFYLEHIMMNLRTDEGVDRARLRSVFGVDPVDAAPKAIAAAEARGDLEVNETAVRTAGRGRFFLDSILTSIAAEIGFLVPARCDWPGGARYGHGRSAPKRR